MGLEEKRWIKEMQDRVIPAAQKKVKDWTGADVAFELDANSFANDLTGLQTLENQGFGRVLEALQVLCKDNTGKEAVKEGLKKVVVKNVDNAAGKKVSFTGGTLELVGAFGKSAYFTDAEIRKTIEAGL